MLDQYLSHYLAESAINLKIRPQKSNGWKIASFFTSKYTAKFNLHLYITESGVTHVSMDVCGSEPRATADCSFGENSWVILGIAKFDLSFEISCNYMKQIVYEIECATKVGNDITYMYTYYFDEGSILYALPHYQGSSNHYNSQIVIMAIVYLDV